MFSERPFAAACVAACLALTGCAQPGEPAPAVEASSAPDVSTPATQATVAQLAQIGATLEVGIPTGSAAYTVSNWRPVPVDAQIIPARGVMYSVDVTVAARTGTTTVNGFYFVVRTADGGSVAPAVGAVRPGITYAQLTPGQSVAGHVAFDLAPGTAVNAVALRDAKGTTLAAWSVGG